MTNHSRKLIKRLPDSSKKRRVRRKRDASKSRKSFGMVTGIKKKKGSKRRRSLLQRSNNRRKHSKLRRRTSLRMGSRKRRRSRTSLRMGSRKRRRSGKGRTLRKKSSSVRRKKSRIRRKGQFAFKEICMKDRLKQDTEVEWSKNNEVFSGVVKKLLEPNDGLELRALVLPKGKKREKLLNCSQLTIVKPENEEPENEEPENEEPENEEPENEEPVVEEPENEEPVEAAKATPPELAPRPEPVEAAKATPPELAPRPEPVEAAKTIPPELAPRPEPVEAAKATPPELAPRPEPVEAVKTIPPELVPRPRPPPRSGRRPRLAPRPSAEVLRSSARARRLREQPSRRSGNTPTLPSIPGESDEPCSEYRINNMSVRFNENGKSIVGLVTLGAPHPPGKIWITTMEEGDESTRLVSCKELFARGKCRTAMKVFGEWRMTGSTFQLNMACLWLIAGFLQNSGAGEAQTWKSIQENALKAITFERGIQEVAWNLIQMENSDCHNGLETEYKEAFVPAPAFIQGEKKKEKKKRETEKILMRYGVTKQMMNSDIKGIVAQMKKHEDAAAELLPPFSALLTQIHNIDISVVWPILRDVVGRALSNDEDTLGKSAERVGDLNWPTTEQWERLKKHGKEDELSYDQLGNMLKRDINELNEEIRRPGWSDLVQRDVLEHLKAHGHSGLGGLIITPVQRFPRLILLSRELVKKSSACCPGGRTEGGRRASATSLRLALSNTRRARDAIRQRKKGKSNTSNGEDQKLVEALDMAKKAEENAKAFDEALKTNSASNGITLRELEKFLAKTTLAGNDAIKFEEEKAILRKGEDNWDSKQQTLVVPLRKLRKAIEDAMLLNLAKAKGGDEKLLKRAEKALLKKTNVIGKIWKVIALALRHKDVNQFREELMIKVNELLTSLTTEPVTEDQQQTIDKLFKTATDVFNILNIEADTFTDDVVLDDLELLDACGTTAAREKYCRFCKNKCREKDTYKAVSMNSEGKETTPFSAVLGRFSRRRRK